MERERNDKLQWASRLGFILATAGAAIGLGNLWKFPYLMGSNGGFQFLAVYLVFIVILGLPVMMLEMTLGRRSGKDPFATYLEMGRGAGVVGALSILAPFMILSYYSMIGGWILKYIFTYATTFSAPDYAAFTSSPETVIWHLLFMAATVFVCLRGVRGIENASKFMMPALFVLLLVIIARSVTLPGAVEGLKFIFVPSGGFKASSVSAAMGQVFYSMSLCMGITITYGSYLGKGENIPGSCGSVAFMDTLIALLAGIAIFPAVFAFGMEPGQGPGLIFDTLPHVFDSLVGGPVFALLFFALVFFAAVTSAIALLEVCVCFVCNTLGWGRRKAVLLLGTAIFLLGVPSCLASNVLKDFTILGYDFFSFMCVLTDNILLPVGGLLMCWFVGWKWDMSILLDEVKQGGKGFRLEKAWIFCIRYLTPVMIAVVTVTGFIDIYKTVFA